ncbi:MAG: hypothetical protein U0N30_08605, partial [Blautia faecis]
KSNVSIAMITADAKNMISLLYRSRFSIFSSSKFPLKSIRCISIAQKIPEENDFFRHLILPKNDRAG